MSEILSDGNSDSFQIICLSSTMRIESFDSHFSFSKLGKVKLNFANTLDCTFSMCSTESHTHS